MNSSFNPDSLIVARNLSGLSQTALFKSSKFDGVNQSSISKIEKGDLIPSSGTVEQLANALNFPTEFFYQEISIANAISFHAYRKKASVPMKHIRQLQAELTIKSLHQEKFHQVLNLETTNLDLRDFASLSPKEASEKFRKLVGLQLHNPVDNLTKLLESLKIDIFPLSFNDAEIDGVTTNFGNQHKAIFININQPGDRYRFSLAHELGHYLLHSNAIESTQEMENEANAFAAELLMPTEGIKDKLTTMDLNEFAKLKEEWKASMGALIFRAKTLGCIDKNQSTTLWKKMSMMGFRKKEPFPLGKEKANRIEDMLNRVSRLEPAEAIWKTLWLSKENFTQLYPSYEVLDMN